MISLKKRLYEIVDARRDSDPASRAVHFFIAAVIIGNVVVLIAETVESIRIIAPGFFYPFEVASVGIFSVEYLLRLWVCTENPRFASPVIGRIRYALTPLALIDLMAILPFYLQFRKLDLRFIRAVRLFRLFRLLKLARYSAGLQTVGRAILKKKEELTVILCVLALLMILSSSAIYYAEHDRQPQVFSSIPASMWWAAVTVTTVGYGDMCPVTVIGRVLGALVALMGIGMFALPAGIMGAAFLEELQQARKQRICPHCGKNLDEPPRQQK